MSLRVFLVFLRALWGTVFLRLLGRSPWARLPFQVDMIARLLKLDWAQVRDWPVARLRADLERRPLPRTATSKVRVRPAEGAPVPSVWVEPSAGADDRVVLYFHGGSYLFGNHRTHADTLARVALEARARVLAPDYRLAPEHPYPAQREDALAVYRWLREQVPPERVVLAGESAGGNLVIAALLALRDAGEPAPAGGAVISAWLDLAATRPSMEGNAATDYGDREMLLAQARLFAGGVPLDDPGVSPLYADLTRLPPLYVMAGGGERLLDENAELVARVRAAGGEAELDEVAGHPHAPIFLAEYSSAAREAVTRMGGWIRRHTGG
ncbi:MAG: alpha/beta hydrolase [Myxococcales bacterium]|nr:alpha/beta hydrolase [Myxococcales bacterium]